jgi:hypothetical protein
MQIEFDLGNKGCNFQECRWNEYGKCCNDVARVDCLEMALAVLCVRKEPDGRDKSEL